MDKNSTVDASAEAARYALMRRLVPVLRHHMVVNLQPIGMIYEVLDRKKLGPGAPDLEAVQEGLAKINHLARAAVNSCLDVVTWLAPDSTVSSSVGSAVNDCVDVLTSNFKFRGFSIRNEVGDAALPISQSALREVLTAALTAATDGAPGPVELVLSAQVAADNALLSFSMLPVEGTGFPAEFAYRPILWNDVEALARLHGVALSRQDASVSMTFAASVAAA